MRGNPPKPAEVRLREGNPGKRPIPAVVRAAPLDVAPEPPADLSDDEQEAWRAMAEPLAQVGLLQRQHLPLLRLFVEAVGLSAQAKRGLQETGLVTAMGSGSQKLSPYFVAWREAGGAALRFGEQLGASPVAMARLGLAQVKGMSLQEEFRQKFGGKARPKAKAKR